MNTARRGLTGLAWILAALLVVAVPSGADELAASSPEDQEIDSRPLIALAEWIRDQRLPVFSVLVSRNGVLVYELYTSSLTRDHAHYLMSVTKSVVSALVGIAIDRRFIDGPDAPDPPRSMTPDALARQARFRSAPNRGIDNGGYGLRLRPIDMQKFGMLYLAKGVWRGEPLISPDWIERSFSPWNRSRSDLAEPNYGWFWWRSDFGRGWRAHMANGWGGQRIAVFPQPRLVVTMTAYLESAGEEQRVFRTLVEDFVMPAVEKGARHRDAAAVTRLTTVLDRLRSAPSPVRPDGESRMMPSVERKAARRTFDDRP